MGVDQLLSADVVTSTGSLPYQEGLALTVWIRQVPWSRLTRPLTATSSGHSRPLFVNTNHCRHPPHPEPHPRQGGGGGAFGIVTGMTLRVHPAPPQLTSLSCAWPLSRTGARVGEPILAKWMDIMPGLPNEWTFYTMGMKRPLGPKVRAACPQALLLLLMVRPLAARCQSGTRSP